MIEPTNQKEVICVREGNIIKGVKQTIDVPFSNIGEAILQTLRSKPDHVGQIEVATGKQSTYAEMEDKSVQCAIWMKKHGIGNGDIVVTCSHNHLDTYVPVFATFYLGAVFNAWSPNPNLDSARYLMKLLLPKIIFVDESSVDVLLEAAKLENVNPKFIVFGAHDGLQSLDVTVENQTKSDVANFIPQKVENPEELSAVLLSSGSTGVPKGIMFSHERLLKNVYTSPLIKSSANILWYSTLYWLSGITMTLSTVFNYATRIIHTHPDAEETCKIIDKYKVNCAFFTPILLTYLARSDAIKTYDLSSLKVIFFGGSKANKEVLETLKKSLPNVGLNQGFGMTEYGRGITHQYTTCKSIESIGFVVPNSELKVVDLKSGEIVGQNKVGELRFKSSFMMLGYYKNLEATKQAFDKDGWLCSGDLGYYNEDCEIFFVDRISELIKYKNHLLSPNEIEQALMINPAVMEVAVVPIPNDKDGEWPMAFVKLISGVNVSEKDLIELSSTFGEEKKLRGGIVFLQDLPKTASAKIARNELKLIAKKLACKQ